MSDSLIPSFWWAMWANRWGRSPKMSDHERFAQVAHQKWVTMSKSLRSLTINERFAQKTDERIPSPGSMAKKINVDSNLWKLSSFLILGGFVKWPLHDLNFLDHWPTPQAGLHCSQILGMLPLPSWSRSRWLIFLSVLYQQLCENLPLTTVLQYM